MAQPAPKPTDRLPWLTEVSRSAPPPAEPRKSGPWGWIAGAAAFVAVGAGSYWLGTRQDGPESTSIAQVDGPLAADPLGQFPDQQVVADELAELNQVLPAEEITIEPEPDRVIIESVPRRIERAAPAPEETADTEVEAAENMVAPAPTLPAQPVRPAVRGRLVQLGAYPSALQANAAWRQAVQRWPYLASKPRVITSLDVRSTDGKATRMYRLQLATASQAQSVVICQRLEKAQQSCVVVY